MKAAELPPNAGIIYKFESSLSFCSGVNYTVFLSVTNQSQINSSLIYNDPVVELPTGTAIILDPSGIEFANTSYIFIDGQLPNSSYTGTIINITQVDEDARMMYDAVYQALRRYNCRDFYPYLSCDPCLNYYKNWACAITFPKWDEDAENQVGSKKLCSDVCWEVVRKCPVELEFHCPSESNAFDTFENGCNSLGLNITSKGLKNTINWAIFITMLVFTAVLQ